MLLINYKVELKLFSADNTIFTIKDTKLYVYFVTLSARDNHSLSKLLCK